MTGPARLSGFTLVRNARLLDFPVVESIRSVLPLCDEVIVNVGRSDDDTLEIVQSVGDPRVRVLETEWDLGAGTAVLRNETARAMAACRHRWGVYIQADEVLHETAIPMLRRAVDAIDRDRAIEGVLVRFHHLFGDPFTEAVNRRWYRYEARIIRLDAGVRPYRDAQGFRVGSTLRKIRARRTEAVMFHYGHTRSAQALRARREIDRVLYRRHAAREREALLRWFPGLQPLQASHPAVARDWVEAHRTDPERTVSRPRFHLAHARYYLSDLIERATGRRPFEFRNYTAV